MGDENRNVQKIVKVFDKEAVSKAKKRLNKNAQFHNVEVTESSIIITNKRTKREITISQFEEKTE